MEIQNEVHIGGRKKVIPSEVIYLEAVENYTMLYLKDGSKIIVATTLKILENILLESNLFFRSHRHYLINLQFVTSYDNSSIILNNHTDIKLSRRKWFLWRNLKIGKVRI